MASIVLALTDALTFKSIGLWPLGRGRSLADVMSEYAYLDRAFPRRSEFEASVIRLGRAGMIKMRSGRFKITPFGRQVARRFRQRARGVIEDAVLVGKAWEGVELPVVDEDFVFRLSEEDFGKAIGLPPSD